MYLLTLHLLMLTLSLATAAVPGPKRKGESHPSKGNNVNSGESHPSKGNQGHSGEFVSSKENNVNSGESHPSKGNQGHSGEFVSSKENLGHCGESHSSKENHGHSGESHSSKEKRCKKSIVDLIFVLDSSGSIGVGDYKKELRFTSDLASVFDVDADAARVGAVIFSQSPRKLFDLNTYKNYKGVSQALIKAPYLKGSTFTDKALNLIVDDGMFSARAGGRPNANRVVVVLTDGKSDNVDRTAQAAQRVKGLNATIVAVGFSKANDVELRKIASRPDYVFNAKNMNQLTATKWTVAELICKASEESAGPTTPEVEWCDY